MDESSFLTAESILFYATFLAYVVAMISYLSFLIGRNETMGKWGSLAAKTGFVSHTLALVSRGIGAGRVPLTNQYEFATSFVWGIILVFILFEKKYGLRAMGAFVTPVAIIIIGYAAMQNKDVRPLMPALKSNWLTFHVATAVVGYGSFGVSFGVSAMYLARDRFRDDDFLKKHLPPAERLDMISYRAVTTGYFFLTLVIITGAIWAERAWGRYWAWDPKETWSLITWMIYSAYLHMRISRGWRGRKAAWFCLIGFICVLFTYVGVNTLIESIHSYR